MGKESEFRVASCELQSCEVEIATLQPATCNLQPAIFLDRDGTVIEQVHHLNRVDDVRVYPFAAVAMRLLKNAGFAIVIVTNQSVVGRGLLTIEGLHAIHEEMKRQLADPELIDGIYYCTTVPTLADRTVVEDPDRKPAPGMLYRAAKDLNLNVPDSWMIGDMVSDLFAGKNAGCRGTILVRTGYGHETEWKGAEPSQTSDDLLSAAQFICESTASEFRG